MRTGMTTFDAIILAGDRRADDPLLKAANVPCKALAPIAGNPMVLRVLQTLADSESIGSRTLCGPELLLDREPRLLEEVDNGRLHWVTNQPTPSLSAYQSMKTVSETRPVLLTTADHALLSVEIVEYFCREAAESGADVVAGMVPYSIILDKFPESKRTVTKFRDGGYCGCNLFAFMTPEGREMAQFWRRVEAQRKKPWRVVGALGWWTVIQYFLGMLSLDQTLNKVGKKLKIRAAAVKMPFAEAAVDVDKVSDWEFVQKMVGHD